MSIFLAILGFYSDGIWIELELGIFNDLTPCVAYIYELPRLGGEMYWCVGVMI